MSEFKEHLKVTKANINNKLTEQASVYYDVGVKLEKLNDALRTVDFHIEQKESKVYRDMSVKYQQVKTVTPTRINHEVNIHPEVVELKEKRLKILRAIGFAKLKIQTLSIMTETMVNYSHNVRAEKNTSALNTIKNN